MFFFRGNIRFKSVSGTSLALIIIIKDLQRGMSGFANKSVWAGSLLMERIIASEAILSWICINTVGTSKDVFSAFPVHTS